MRGEKQAEQEKANSSLEEQSNSYESLLREQARKKDYTIFLLDTKGYIVSWDRAAEQLKGYTAEEIIGQSFTKFYKKETTDIHYPEHELQIAKETGHFEEEGWRVRSDGSKFWANVMTIPNYDKNRCHTGFIKVIRDLTEQLIDERQRILQQGIDSIKNYAIFLLDANCQVLTWNKGAEHIYGYTAEEIIGKSCSKFYTPEKTAEKTPEHELILARQNGHLEIEGQRIRKDGTAFWANVIVTPIFDADKELIGCVEVIRDLTEKKLVEQALQESEQEFKLIAESLPQMVWTTEPNGKVDYYNQRWEEYTGYGKELLGWGWVDVLHPQDAPRLLAQWEESRKTGNPYQCEVRMRNREGIYRWQIDRATPLRDAEGNIIKWFGTCTDIHDLKLTESKLRSVTERLDMTLKAAKIGTWKWSLTNNTAELDENIFYLFDIDPTGFNHTVPEILQRVHPDDQERIAAALKRCIAENLFYEVEFRVVRRDHTVRYVASRGKVHYDANKQPLYIVGISHDITLEKERQHQREDEIRKQNLQEFIDTICHELRNPLNGIFGGTELLKGIIQTIKFIYAQQDISTLSEETQEKLQGALKDAGEQLDTIRNCAEQQKVIVDDVLDLSKVESGEIEFNPIPTSLKKLIRNVVKMFKPQIASKNLKVEMDLPKDINWLKVDSHRLTQILINLFSNAIKFTENGGIQIIAVTKPLSEQEIQLQIAVKDSGIGMTSEEQSYIFERFKQASPTIYSRYGGSGLGLIISKKLVEKMGGTIEVESRKWHGTQFIFTVKCQSLSPEEQAECKGESYKQTETMSSTLKPLANLNVLVVEDNLINQRILTKYLEQVSCFSQIANDGLEAIQKSEKLRFDAILMDIEMPKMNGLEATQKIREIEAAKGYRIPIIGLSGNARDEQKNKALEAGMDDYLAKPYHKEDIYRLLTQYIYNNKTAEKKSHELQLKPQAEFSTTEFLSPKYLR